MKCSLILSRRLKILGLMMGMLLFCFLSHPSLASSPDTPVPFAEANSAGTPPTRAARDAYSLPPDKLVKAVRLSRDYTLLHFAAIGGQILFLLLLLLSGALGKLARWVQTLTPKRWLQGLLFLPLLLLLVSLADLPFHIVGHWLSLSYGLSIQHWGSWLLDRAKALLLTLVFGTAMLMAFVRLFRKFPRHWWFYFWLSSLPFIVASVFLVPVVIDPFFNHFEPLMQSHPVLVQDLKRVVARTGTEIPAERMFLMRASEKLTVPNAYVTGIGPTKRVVVWDTSITTESTDEILFLFAHESGHYVLNHIWKGMAFYALLILLMLWIGYHLVGWMMARYGARREIASLEEWPAFGVLLLAYCLLGFVSEPIANGFSRALEHDADVYGQEAIHGIVANPQATAQKVFQLLGEAYLEDPNPPAWVVFWTYDHPSIQHRATFAAGYNSWKAGQKPEYFPRDERK